MSTTGFCWREKDGISFLAPTFFETLGLCGGYSPRSDKAGGDLDLDLRRGGSRKTVLENRSRVCKATGVSLDRLVLAEQVHGAGVAVVGDADAGRGARDPEEAVRGADALVTQSGVIAIGALGADCPLVILADGDARALGIAHSGWRGTAAGVVPATVAALGGMGVDAGCLWAAVGPAIGVCCYEVGEDVRAGFGDSLAREGGEGGVFAEREGKLFLDLKGAIGRQLLDSGLIAERISIAPHCTACGTSPFFSCRKEGAGAGRFAGIVALTRSH